MNAQTQFIADVPARKMPTPAEVMEAYTRAAMTIEAETGLMIPTQLLKNEACRILYGDAK